MHGSGLVVGYTWRDGEPHLRLRTHVGLVAHALGGVVGIYVTGARRCIGHHDGGPRPCPRDAEPVGRQCDECKRRDRLRPCMTCNGFRCPRLDEASAARCRSRHHLYLACFGERQLKVGTAVDARRDARIIEQGPLAAARVASGAGPEVKQMEHLLARRGFTEAMRRSRKTMLLGSAMEPREAERLVLAAAARLPELLPQRLHALLHPPLLVEQPELAVRSRKLPVLPQPVQPGTQILGRVAGAVGHTLFVEDDDGVFAVDLGELVGRIVEFDPRRRARRPEVQLGLFP